MRKPKPGNAKVYPRSLAELRQAPRSPGCLKWGDSNALQVFPNLSNGYASHPFHIDSPSHPFPGNKMTPVHLFFLSPSNRWWQSILTSHWARSYWTHPWLLVTVPYHQPLSRRRCDRGSKISEHRDLGGSVVKNLLANAGDLGSFPGEGNGNPLQHSCLGNPEDRGAWQATVHGVTKELDMTEWLNNKGSRWGQAAFIACKN